jgi:thiamine-phosphate pyrophosphorylase
VRFGIGPSLKMERNPAFMIQKMLLYAITDRNQLPGSEAERSAALVELARQWVRGGVDYLQIREKDLSPEELLPLARQIIDAVRSEGAKTKILLNGAVSLALEVKADGVHLPGNTPPEAAAGAKEKYASAGIEAILSQSCHSPEEAAAAAKDASLILYAPVFEKITTQSTLTGKGIKALEAACKAASCTPVLALGGVTLQNAQACLNAGAKGIAAIRLFLNDDWQNLRKISG